MRHPWRAAAALALLALAPKCVVCLAAYVGLGALLGLGGPEICGAPADWTTVLAACGVAIGLGALGLRAACRRRRRQSGRPPELRVEG